jgi:hypothetical protein
MRKARYVAALLSLTFALTATAVPREKAKEPGIGKVIVRLLKLFSVKPLGDLPSPPHP